jgi:hypothetical protein
LLDPYAAAEIVTVVAVVTCAVETPNVALAESAGIEIDAGTTAAGSSLLSETTAPPAGAGDPSVTVPVALPEPPVIVAGDTETLAT